MLAKTLESERPIGCDLKARHTVGWRTSSVTESRAMVASDSHAEVSSALPHEFKELAHDCCTEFSAPTRNYTQKKLVIHFTNKDFRTVSLPFLSTSAFGSQLQKKHGTERRTDLRNPRCGSSPFLPNARLWRTRAGDRIGRMSRSCRHVHDGSPHRASGLGGICAITTCTRVQEWRYFLSAVAFRASSP